jgi:hypothetical protein
MLKKRGQIKLYHALKIVDSPPSQFTMVDSLCKWNLLHRTG